MLPLSLLKTAQGHPMLVELKNGETYNGHLVNCDTWMNIHLREVICTSKDGDRFWRMPECYIRGNTIKYLRVPDEVIDKVQEETKTRSAIPLNKQLYTLSYVCVTSGAAALVFSALYILQTMYGDMQQLNPLWVDIWNFKYPFLPLEWIGMNAMLVYVMAAEGIFAGFVNGWYYDDPHNTLIHWIQKHIFIKIVHILEALTSYPSSASQLGGLRMN
ncbi:UNVERIFIED_CONTAM: putative U6 snRNA-associated Sm-like protein LSm4 [Sesamum latifolium]|uniref:U6 snRNA-associated Sm-like protein LSm4 n=1 Tax=Sesamum latifolium TaxID=2727402 RepID=A0AAW2V0D9_9LAMI